ncbi:hypothetical protein Ppb6_00941 [Photorhabdus australis subsp. thailandensis]|uniref:Uncharacterized protein n=2 Tax=Photorhabdus australis TaxID=286156 RepID=A0A1C0U7M5_9GAMM|nr:hypothetical protein Ppb6_00941 [Photorhabdus australis subsp. thailandensis]
MYEKKKDISKGYLIKTNIIQRNELQDIPEFKDYKESSVIVVTAPRRKHRGFPLLRPQPSV